jgi:hypothetical protein
MIFNVAMELHWEPAVLDRLFLDEIDHHGLIFWNEKIKLLHKES